jgi:actin-like ATPase involved in cell morphogenesis
LNNVIDVGCTSCGKAYEVPERGAGRKAECPNCGATMMVPQVIEDSSVQQSSAEPKQIHQQDSARPVYSTPGPRLAIDFGTTRTKVAYWNDDKNQPDLINIGIEIRTSIPSAFYIPVTGTTNIQVGDDASDNVHTDPAGVVIGLKKEIHRPGKKRIGQGRPALGRVELASFLFKHIREYCEDNSFRKQSITSCTLTIPVTFEQKKRDCIRRAAELGGFTDVDLLEEPVAAARHWIASRQARDTAYVFVCDVGGGTIDFALLKQDEDQFVSVPNAITAGSPKGGDDLDADIFEASVGLGEVTTEVVTEYRSSFLSKIRQLRERFGRTGKTRPVNIKGKSLEIAENTVRECVEKFVDFVYMRLEEFIQHCHQKVPNCGTPPILLVGGGSKIEGLKEKLESNSDWEIINWEDADYAVVLGAAGAIGTDQPTPSDKPSRRTRKKATPNSKSGSGKTEEPETEFFKYQLASRRAKLTALSMVKIHELIEKHQVVLSKRLNKHDLVKAVSEEKAISTHEIGLWVANIPKPPRRKDNSKKRPEPKSPPRETHAPKHDYSWVKYVWFFFLGAMLIAKGCPALLR